MNHEDYNLFANTTDLQNVARDLPGKLHLEENDLFKYHRVGWPNPFLKSLDHIIKENILFEVYKLQSELVSTTNEMRGFCILLTLTEVAIRAGSFNADHCQRIIKSCLGTLKSYKYSKHAILQAGAVVGLSKLEPETALTWCRKFIRDGSPLYCSECLAQAAQTVLEQIGQAEDWHLQLLMVSHYDKGIRQRAEKAQQTMFSRVGAPDKTIMDILQRLIMENWVVEPDSKSLITMACLDFLKKTSTNAFKSALAFFTDEKSRERLAEISTIPELVPELKELAVSDLGCIADSALVSLGKVAPMYAVDVIKDNRLLRDPGHTRTGVALYIVAQNSPTSYFLQDVIAVSKRRDSLSRTDAAETLLEMPHRQAAGELFCMLSDFNDRVRASVQDFLYTAAEEKGFTLAWKKMHGEKTTLQDVRCESKAAMTWGEEFGSGWLDQKVLVKSTRAGFSLTSRPRKAAPVVINISELPVAMGLPFGKEIQKGAILHGLSRHRFCDQTEDFKKTLRKAKKLDLMELFNLVWTTKLEEVTRSAWEEADILLNHLGFYAFCHEPQEMGLQDYAAIVNLPTEEVSSNFQNGRFPGRLDESTQFHGSAKVSLDGMQLVSLTENHIPFLQLALITRGQFLPSGWIHLQANEASKLLPSKFAPLGNKEIIELCGDLAELVGYGTRVRNQISILSNKFRRPELSRLHSRWEVMVEISGGSACV